jgi:DNA-directed RNA polymerase subunit RPC12/RpoP
MNESSEKRGLPTCPECGSTRSQDAVPYLTVDGAVGVYTCAACGVQFESWSVSVDAQGMSTATA